jgi:hypothetical protein
MFQCKKREAVNDRFLRDMYAGNGKTAKDFSGKFPNCPSVRIFEKIAVEVQ